MLLGIACLMVTLLCSQEAKAQLEVDITLDCEASQVELDVSPGSGGSATVTCSIENGALYEKTVALSLNITGTDVDGSLSDNQVVVAASTTEEVTLMKAIKRLFDPDLILNPGKVVDMDTPGRGDS